MVWSNMCPWVDLYLPFFYAYCKIGTFGVWGIYCFVNMWRPLIKIGVFTFLWNDIYLNCKSHELAASIFHKECNSKTQTLSQPVFKFWIHFEVSSRFQLPSYMYRNYKPITKTGCPQILRRCPKFCFSKVEIILEHR